MRINPLPVIVTAAAVFLLFKLKFFMIIHPIKTMRKIKKALLKKGAASSLFMALAGTLGVGNIFGIAVGILVGGAGSVFWIIVSGVFSCVVKYAEVITAEQMYKQGDRVGCAFFYVIKRALPKGECLAPVYATLTVLLSLFMGGAMQTHAAVSCVNSFLQIKPIVASLIFTLPVCFAISGGGGKIRRITSFVVPLTTIIYIISTFCVIAFNYNNVFSVIKSIFSDAFEVRGVAGGILGFLTSGAIKEGFSRGILSNEAGIGSSSSSHVASSADSVEKGLLGVVEVVFDTLILCPLTGVAILSSDIAYSGSLGMELVYSAFNSVSPILSALLTFAILAFAYSTVICWYYYGIGAVGCIFSDRIKPLFTILFITFVALSALIPEQTMVILTDTVILLMSFLCIPALIKSSDRIRELSEL